MLTVIWLAVMGGGIVPGAITLAAVGLALVWTVLASCSPENGTSRVRAVGGAGAIFLLFLVITTIPVPVGFSVFHGGLRHAQNLEALSRFQQAEQLDLVSTPVRRFALSRNLGGTLRMMVLTVCVLSFVMLTAGMGMRMRRVYLRFLVLLGVLIGAVGYIGQTLVPQEHTLWWVLPIPVSQPGPMACFANRNHFAGFLALLAVPSMVLWVDDLVARRWLHAVLMMAGVCLMIFALIMSQSRGGFLAFVCGILVVGLWKFYRALFVGPDPLRGGQATRAVSLDGGLRPERRQRLWMAVFIPVIGMLLVAVILWRSPAPVRARLADWVRQPLTALTAQTRFEAWQDTYIIWRHYPLIGAGANALRTVYPQHRLGSRRESRTHASNQYLQLLAETGIVGTFLAAVWVVAWLRALGIRTGGCKSAAERSIAETGSAGIPAASVCDRDFFVGVTLGAVTVAGVHGLVDFPHHIPLYAVVLASLAGFGLAAPSSVANREASSAGARCCAVWCLVVVLMAAPAWRRMHRGDNPNALPHASLPELMHAVAWAPTSWQAWFEFGRRCFLAQTWDAARLGENAISYAAQLDPNNYLLWYEVGKLRINMNDRRGAQKAFERVRELRSWVPIPDL